MGGQYHINLSTCDHNCKWEKTRKQTNDNPHNNNKSRHDSEVKIITHKLNDPKLYVNEWIFVHRYCVNHILCVPVDTLDDIQKV